MRFLEKSDRPFNFFEHFKCEWIGHLTRFKCELIFVFWACAQLGFGAWAWLGPGLGLAWAWPGVLMLPSRTAGGQRDQARDIRRALQISVPVVVVVVVLQDALFSCLQFCRNCSEHQ